MWRALPPVAAAAAAVLEAPRALVGGLVVVGAVLAADALTALRGSTMADRVLVGVGGALVVLVLTGVVLDVTGIGLRPATWTAALIVLEVAALGAAAVLPVRAPRDGWGPPGRIDGSTLLRVLPWLGAAVVVTGVAVHASALSLAQTDEPPLQMSFERVSGTSVQVVVTSTEPIGPLELRTASDDSEVSYPLITLGADGVDATTVPLPASGRFVITLSYPDQTEPLRTIVLDR